LVIIYRFEVGKLRLIPENGEISGIMRCLTITSFEELIFCMQKQGQTLLILFIQKPC